MRYPLLAGTALAVLTLLPSGSQAHFQMLQPSGWLVEENALGDPQKRALVLSITAAQRAKLGFRDVQFSVSDTQAAGTPLSSQAVKPAPMG